MSVPLTKNNEEWLEYDGLVVKNPEGHSVKIKVESYTARYPFEQKVISVHAEYVNKSAKAYREVKVQLRDDWSTDVLSSDVEVTVFYLQACRTAHEKLMQDIAWNWK